MKTKIFLLLTVLFIAGGCAREAIWSEIHYNSFNTVIQIKAPLPQKELEAMSKKAFARFEELSRLFDIYYGYDGIVNLYDLNRRAAVEPVAVSDEIMRLLDYSIQAHRMTEGRVNIAMGTVLSLWHESREKGRLPDEEALALAMQHSDINDLILDREQGTVYFRDPGLRLDVGSVAKGWACQVVAEELSAAGYEDFLLYAGGNIVVRGMARRAGIGGQDQLWSVGIQDPNGQTTQGAAVVEVTDCAVVTSGDYQRYMMIYGKRYHHIIDPRTGYPSGYSRSVTVISPDSAQADVLSTDLFLLPAQEAVLRADKLGIGVFIIDGNENHLKNSFWP